MVFDIISFAERETDTASEYARVAESADAHV